MQCCYNQVNSKSLEGTSDFSCIENKSPCIWHIQTANVFQSGFVWVTEEFSFSTGADRILTNSSPPWGKNESSFQGQYLVPTWIRSTSQAATFHLPFLHHYPWELEPEAYSTKAETDCKALWPVTELVSRRAGTRAAPSASKVQVTTTSQHFFLGMGFEAPLLYDSMNTGLKDNLFYADLVAKMHESKLNFLPWTSLKSHPKSIYLSESKCYLTDFIEIRLGSMQLCRDEFCLPYSNRPILGPIGLLIKKPDLVE